MRSLSMQALLPAIDCGQQNCIIWLRNGSLMISWEIFNLKSCHLAPTSPKHALSRHLRKWRWRTAGVLSQEIPYCLSDKEAHRRRKPVQILWNLGIQDSSRLVVSWHTARNRWWFFVTYPELMGWTKTDVWIEPWRLNSEKPEKPICWRGSQISRDKNILLLGVWRVHLCVCVFVFPLSKSSVAENASSLPTPIIFKWVWVKIRDFTRIKDQNPGGILEQIALRSAISSKFAALPAKSS